MRTTLGQLVSELVDQYERIYHDHDLATMAASVLIEDMSQAGTVRRSRTDDITVRIRRPR